MAASQTGKTELALNFCDYIIDRDPGPILLVLPRVEDGEAWSKDCLAPMLRNTPCLRGKVADVRTRDSNNQIRHKQFQGGNITIAGANSPAGLAMRPIRYVLLDEVDRYPASAGTEGDPVSLAVKRSANWWNRQWLHEYGVALPVAACAIDSGFHTQAVYDFCRTRYHRRIFAITENRII